MLMVFSFIGALGQQGDSCQAKADCEAGMSCTNGECDPGNKEGSSCKRAADCPTPLRCRANVCTNVQQPAQAPPPSAPPASPYPQQQQAYPRQQYPQTPAPHAPPIGYDSSQSQFGGSVVNVFITSINPEMTVLFSLRQGGKGGMPVGQCQTPCNLQVPPGSYWADATGEGIAQTGKVLRLQHDLQVQVRPGGGAGGGIALVVLGPLCVVVGAVLAGMSGGNAGFLGSGIGTIVLGVLGTVFGSVLIANSGSKIIPGAHGFSFNYTPIKAGGGIGTMGFAF